VVDPEYTAPFIRRIRPSVRCPVEDALASESGSVTVREIAVEIRAAKKTHCVTSPASFDVMTGDGDDILHA